MMSATRPLAIPVPHEEIAAFCRKWGIRKLSFFGSVVRDDFGPESDVDVLVEFDRPIGFAADRAEAELACLLGRKVDLVKEELLNRWMRKDVMAEAVVEYVQEK